MGQKGGVLAQRVCGTVNVVCIMRVGLPGGLRGVHGGGRRHMGGAEGWQPPQWSIPLVGRWRSLEEEASVFAHREVIWMQQGSVAGSGQFGQAAACCYSNRSLLSAQRMEPEDGNREIFLFFWKQRGDFEWVKRGRS